MYEELLGMGYLYKDMYEMTLKELDDTIEKRKMFIGYEIYRLASLTRSPFVKNFPASPKEACPELYPIQKGIPMPEFLREKAMKRGVI